MFLRVRPSARDVQRFLEESRHLPLSYGPPGLTRRTAEGFNVDEAAGVVGTGDVAFARAWDALRSWSHFKLGWVELFPSGPSVDEGSVVAVLVNHLGFWSLNGCRIVYTIDDEAGTRQKGFAYGTLTNHAECGEELFAVSMDAATGAVTYRIRAMSRPRALLARCGYPIVRTLQARFRAGSIEAMRRATAQST